MTELNRTITSENRKIVNELKKLQSKSSFQPIAQQPIMEFPMMGKRKIDDTPASVTLSQGSLGLTATKSLMDTHEPSEATPRVKKPRGLPRKQPAVEEEY